MQVHKYPYFDQDVLEIAEFLQMLKTTFHIKSSCVQIHYAPDGKINMASTKVMGDLIRNLHIAIPKRI